jgi:collagenase-like PrtC family protease
MTNEITEADRAVARRVIRREDLRKIRTETERIELWVGTAYNAACLSAAQGRAYAKALRGAK